MKEIILSFLLIGILSNASAEIVCDNDGTLIPNPEDCSSFFVCDNGVPKLQQCPPTLHFNPEAMVCDRPENVNCQVGSTLKPTTKNPPTNGPTTEGTTTEIISTEGPSTEEPTTVELSTEGTTTERLSTEGPSTEGTTVPTTPPNSAQCPSTGSHLLPNLNDCSSFVVCIEGHNTTISCPNGMMYNDQIKTCDLPQNVNCKGSEVTTTEVPETSTPGKVTELSTTEVTTSDLSTTEGITRTDGPSTWPTTEGTTTPSPNKCPSNGSAIIPNPNDCASFFVCIEGHHITIPCPAGMLYNNDIQTCDKPENVNCNLNEGTSSEPPLIFSTTDPSTISDESTTEGTITTTPSESTSPETTTQQWETTTQQWETTTQQWETTIPDFTTTVQPGYKPDCPEDGYAVLENPESCSSFYVCVNGIYGLVQCPAGSDFNPATVKCDLPENPQCRAETTGSPPTVPPYIPACPENGTTLLPDPYSCSSFYICINGNYAQLSCPDDFEFNVTSKSCVHSQNSTCGVIKTYELEFECKEDGSFPNPDDCSKYYVCVGDQVFPMECPGGLHFDPSLATCNNPDQAQCSTGTTEEPSSTKPTTITPKPTTTSPQPTTPTPEPISTTHQTSSQKPTTGRPGTEPECPDEGTSILPNPEDCSQFFICIEGSFDVIDCPEGYAFNPDLGRCDLAENVNCNSGTTPSPSHPDCPSEGSQKLPNPDDCGSYIYCINGNSAIIECPDGLNYDSDKEECSSSATCSIDSTTSPKPTTTSTTKKPTTTDNPTTSDESSTTDNSPTLSPGECTAEGELLPNPNDCESFFLCANGEPVQIECPPGLEFNPDMLYCDNPSTANCSQKFRLS